MQKQKFMLLVVFVAIQRKKKKKKKTRTEMEPFNMSDLASHDKFHLVLECVCVPKNAKCLFYNHEIFYPV